MTDKVLNCLNDLSAGDDLTLCHTELFYDGQNLIVKMSEPVDDFKISKHNTS